MKFNSLVAPLGILALSLSACKKDEAATPVPMAKGSGSAVAVAPTPTPTPPAPTPTPEPSKAGMPIGNDLVGKPAPDFTLPDLDGNDISLAAFKGKTVVLEWFNPQCPFVVAAHTKGSLVAAAKEFTDKGVVWLSINSGAVGKQGNELTVNVNAAKEWAIVNPILRDEAGTVGNAYGATNTPNMFVIDPEGVIRYAGAIDNSPDGEAASPEGGTLVKYVDAALADLEAKRPVAIPSTKPYGCGVKYAS